MILCGYVLTAKLAIMTNAAGKLLAILMVMLMPWV
jgi:hypothetical protein